MNRLKKKQSLLVNSHSKKSSLDKQRSSYQRLTIYASPHHLRNTTNYFISNPNSLQKKKSKVNKKKVNKSKKFREEPTRQTIASSSEEDKWKQDLKLTFRPSTIKKKDNFPFNDSLKCIQQLNDYNLRNSSQSFMNLNNSFPKHQLKKICLSHKERIYLIDWLSYIVTEFGLRRNTLHLAVAFLDQYLSKKEVLSNMKLQIFGAGSLLLAIKQEERGGQNENLSVLSRQQIGSSKEQIIKCQSQIVLGLGFKLNYPTIAFWCDYFSQKWDKFVSKCSQPSYNEYSSLREHLIVIRKPQGKNYRYYRQLTQLSDAIIMNADHQLYQFPKLSLALLYLIARINTESEMLQLNTSFTYQSYYEAFKLKSTPIFKDKLGFNAIFNDFLVEACDFEITEIIKPIKWCSMFLNMGFTYQINDTIYQSSINYEQFLSFSTYSQHIRNYALSSIKFIS